MLTVCSGEDRRTETLQVTGASPSNWSTSSVWTEELDDTELVRTMTESGTLTGYQRLAAPLWSVTPGPGGGYFEEAKAKQVEGDKQDKLLYAMHEGRMKLKMPEWGGLMEFDRSATWEKFVDGVTGAIDGFLAGLNPVESVWSLPKIGAVGGQTGVYNVWKRELNRGPGRAPNRGPPAVKE